jgi:hypothetical protein
MSHPKKPKKKPTGDYATGYCKPPESAKWQPGKSGNPSGRPKKIPTWEELVVEEAFKPVKATVKGTEITTTMVQLLLHCGYQKAFKVDTPALKTMMSQSQSAIEKVNKKAEEEEKAQPRPKINWTEEHEKLFQQMEAAVQEHNANLDTRPIASDGTPK